MIKPAAQRGVLTHLKLERLFPLQAVTSLKEKGDSPYPHKFKVDLSLEDFIAKFSSIKAGEHLTDQVLSLAGQFESFPNFVAKSGGIDF